MPTNPVELFLNRDFSKVAARDLIEQFTAIIDEVVNYGTTVYARCKPTFTSMDLNEEGVPLVIYLHILEMADGISALLKEVCATPALPLARTMFEALLNLEYILRSDTSRRSRSWLAAFMLERVEACESMLNNGKAKAGHAGEPVVDFSKLSPQLSTDKKHYTILLAAPEFEEILSERKKLKKYPKWYSLFSGPKNLRELAAELNREKEYFTFYGYWSSISHVSDLGRFLARGSSSSPMARLLRDPNDLTLKVAGMAAIMFPVRANRFILDKYRPGEKDSSEWYRNEIKPRLDQLSPF